MSMNLFKKLNGYTLSEDFIRRFEKRPFSPNSEKDRKDLKTCKPKKHPHEKKQ